MPFRLGRPLRNDRQSSGFLNCSCSRSILRMPCPGLYEDPVLLVRGQHLAGNRRAIRTREGIRMNAGFQEQKRIRAERGSRTRPRVVRADLARDHWRRLVPIHKAIFFTDQAGNR